MYGAGAFPLTLTKGDTIPSLWIPGEAAQAVINEREGVAEAERVFGDFAKRLKAIDSRLTLFLCDEDRPIADPEASDDVMRALIEEAELRPEEHQLRVGFYYILRRNEDGTITLWEISDNGAYMEPNERILEAFRSGDATRTRESPERLRKKERERQAKEAERRRERQAEERQDRMLDKLTYETRLQIPVGTRWTQKKKAA